MSIIRRTVELSCTFLVQYNTQSEKRWYVPDISHLELKIIVLLWKVQCILYYYCIKRPDLFLGVKYLPFCFIPKFATELVQTAHLSEIDISQGLQMMRGSCSLLYSYSFTVIEILILTSVKNSSILLDQNHQFLLFRTLICLKTHWGRKSGSFTLV